MVMEIGEEDGFFVLGVLEGCEDNMIINLKMFDI